MLETCLRNKVIRDFLNLYKQSRWKELIPSLIEIAILNLNSSFKTLFFSEEDIHNIIEELKINLDKKDGIIEEQKPKKEFQQNIIFSKPSNEWRTADGGVEPISSINYRINDNRNILFDGSSISNNNIKFSHSLKNRDKDRDINIKNQKKIKNTKSKIKEQVELDKKNYYNKKSADDNFKKSINQNQTEKINYAISYDKNLEPELIEKTTINKSKKGGKKIIEKMTQEEYDQQFPPDQNDEQNYNENNYDYEEGENEEQNYEENEEEEYFNEQNQNENDQQEFYGNNLVKNNISNKNSNNLNNNFNINNNNEIKINNQNIQNLNNQIKKKKNNLYHYKNGINNKSNDIILNNLNNIKQANSNNILDNNKNNNKLNLIQNPQQTFNPYHYNNNNQQKDTEINSDKNNYINIESNSSDRQNINNDYNYNPNPSGQFNINNNNFKTGFSESEDKNSKLIGIDQKYKKKIDELEKNILNNDKQQSKNNNYNNNNYSSNKNNIDNYANKLKVNITNMEEYKMKNGINSDGFMLNNNNLNNKIVEENNFNINAEEENDNENNEENKNGNEENNLSDSDMQEDGALSQMSNMTERTKSLFKRTMDEYPPMEEDTFFDQLQTK